MSPEICFYGVKAKPFYNYYEKIYVKHWKKQEKQQGMRFKPSKSSHHTDVASRHVNFIERQVLQMMKQIR